MAITLEVRGRLLKSRLARRLSGNLHDSSAFRHPLPVHGPGVSLVRGLRSRQRPPRSSCTRKRVACATRTCNPSASPTSAGCTASYPTRIDPCCSRPRAASSGARHVGAGLGGPAAVVLRAKPLLGVPTLCLSSCAPGGGGAGGASADLCRAGWFRFACRNAKGRVLVLVREPSRLSSQCARLS